MRLPLFGFLAALAALIPPGSLTAAFELYMSGDSDGNDNGSDIAVLLIACTCRSEGFDGNVLQYVETAAEELMLPLSINLQDASRMNVSDVEAVLSGLLAEQGEVAVIYPGCSNDTSFLANVINYFNSTLITYAFSNLPNVPQRNHLRMVPSESHLASGVGSLLEYFGWRRLVVLTENLPIFRSIQTALDVVSTPTGVNITKATQETLAEGDTFEAVMADNRIVLINAFPDIARSILCKGWRDKRLFPLYVWITYEWNSEEWWCQSQDTSSSCSVAGRKNTPGSCTNQEIESMLEHSLVVSHYQTGPGGSMEFTSNYERHVYDAMEALSILANHTRRGVEISFGLLDSISFSGVSGPVSFKDGIRELENLTIKQYRRDNGYLKLVPIGKQPVRESGDFTYLSGEDNNTVWQYNTVPKDGTPRNETNPPLISLLVLTYTYASGGIIFAFVCLVFNIVFRNKRYIKLTSPNLNYIIIVGAIVFYCSVYPFFNVNRHSTTLLISLCNMRTWLISIGFTLCYGPINVKMWRVYHICHKPTPSMKKVLLKDWHLMLVIASLLTVDLVLLTITTAVESLRYSLLLIDDKERHDSIEDNITVNYQVERCYSSKELYFLPFLIGYKLVLQAIGVFLAFNIRKVKIKGLNDSKEISAVLYVTTILIFIVIASTFLFGDYINVDATVYGLTISTATTCVLLFIFVPKMVALYKDPKGEDIFSMPTQTPHSPITPCNCGHNNNNTGNKPQLCTTSLEDKGVIQELEKRVKELECQLKELVCSPDTTITSVDIEQSTAATSMTQSE